MLRAEVTRSAIFNFGACVTSDHTTAQAGQDWGRFLSIHSVRGSLSTRDGTVEGKGEKATESEVVSRKLVLGFRMASSWGPSLAAEKSVDLGKFVASHALCHFWVELRNE